MIYFARYDTRHRVNIHHREQTHPRVDLPVANDGTKYCSGRTQTQLSLSRQGRWVTLTQHAAAG